MKSLRDDIQTNLDEIRQISSTDFAALAFSYPQTIRWHYASGNRNERYKRIVLRPGKGLAGKVMQSGRPMQLHSNAPGSGDDPREYPILLAENLKSVIGVPVMNGEHVRGVLLVGSRSFVDFDDTILKRVSDFAERFGPMIEQLGGNPDAEISTIPIYSHMGNHESL